MSEETKDDLFGDEEVQTETKPKTKKSTKKKEEVDPTRMEDGQEYKNAMKRYRCKVESTRKNIQSFELTYPHPKNRFRPVPIRGHCGVWIEQGLPMYVIKALQSSYHMETTENPGPDGTIKAEAVRVPDYTVTVEEEIQDPKYPDQTSLQMKE